MKTFRMLGMALVVVMFGFAMTSCDSDEDDYQFTYENPYKDYPQLIVGKWFNFTPEASMFLDYKADGTMNAIGFDKEIGWKSVKGTYRLESNTLIDSYERQDGSATEMSNRIEVSREKLVYKAGSNSIQPELGDKVHYRVQESFDIKGSYTFLNAVAKVEPAEGKTALQLSEGITFQGNNTIPVEMLQGERIIEAAKSFFADATFAADGKLEHQIGGETKHKNYTHEGNSLVFNLYEGSDVYKVRATTFPDEDGDRLFIIMPKQGAWMGGFVELIEKENAGLKMTEAQIKELETEFMDTFETFTVILSLSKK